MRRLGALALADLALFLAWGHAVWPAPLLPAPLAGALHLALTLAALASARRLDERLSGWNGLAFPLGVVAGPAGVLGLAWLRPWALLPARAPVPIGAQNDEPAGPPVEGKADRTIARIADQRLRIPASAQLQSLAMILRHGDLPSRCKALQTVVRSFEPKLSPLVSAALRDPDQTVRALAAATAAQVSANIAARAARIETSGERGRPPTCEARFDAAMLLFDHGVNNVLLSQAQRLTLRGKAAAMLQTLSREAGGLGKLRAPVAAALVRLGGEPGGSGPARPRRQRRGTMREHPA